jgi:hypothetical protein
MMASVLDAQFGVKAETVYGTPVAAVDRFYELNPGDGFDYRPNRVQGTGMRVNAIGPRSNRRVTPNGDYGGTFNLEVLSKSFGVLWNLACGGTATNTLVSGTTYQVVHTLGGVLKPFTAQLGVPRVQSDGSAVIDAFTALGCTLPSWGLSMDNSDILKMTLDVDARTMTTATALATASYPTGSNLFSFAGATLAGGTYTAPTATALAAGATALPNVTNFSLDVARNADVSRYLAGSGGLKAIPIPGLAAVTGTIGVEYSDTVYRDGFLNDTDFTLVVNFTAGALSTGLETLQIALPNIRLDGELPKPSGETTKVSCNFTALENGTNPLLQVVQRTSESAL